MTPALNAALSALGALGKRLEVTAHNVANAGTEGFQRGRALLQEGEPSGVRVTLSRVEAPGLALLSGQGGGQARESSNVDLAGEMIDLRATRQAFRANLKTLETEEEMLGSLFDVLA